ncbi:MAG: hypothetical protein IT435_02915 [Phycisphaerales bacterium]|nr:hypothetical protein [Phycisphaerales bacterium]
MRSTVPGGVMSLHHLSILVAIAGLSIGIGAIAAPPAIAPPPAETEPAPAEVPPIAKAVEALLSADYLTDDERKDLRIRHGIWEAGDLDTPARRARAALTAGRYHDAAFNDPAVPIEDRAEAFIGRGDLTNALELLADNASIRAARLRSQALWESGRLDEARTSLQALAGILMERKLDKAAEIADAVRAMVVLTRLTGDQVAPGPADDRGREIDFKMLMAVLARAREEIDRLEPSVYLAEAELLDEKENGAEAVDALLRAIELNPRNARAWALAGRFASDGWDFDRALSIAARLDRIALWDESGDVYTPRSVLGGEIAARTYLKLQDPDAAEAALTRALDLAPQNRSLLALRAASAASNFNDALLAERLAAFDVFSPQSPDACYEVGAILSDLRQYADSEKYLTEAARRAPRWAIVQTELGLLQVQAGRDAEALATLENAAALDPFNVRVANSLTLVREIRTYDRVTSDHFEIRHKPGLDALLAKEMLPTMEENFARVTGNDPGGIDHVPAGRTVIELYPDHHWFSVRITGVRKVHTIAAATGPVIAMERPMTGPGHSIGPYDWPRVLRHEYTHTVTLSRTKNRLPHWFTEASAVYLEDSPRDETRCMMLTKAIETDGLLDFTTINTAFVRPRTPNERGLAYAQGHWMYEYIVMRFGPRAPLNLMDRYARGQREPEAFKEELGLSREQFLDQFKIWARAQAQAWGTIPPDGVPTVNELLSAERQARASDPGQASAAAEIEPTPELVSTWLEKYPQHPDLLRLAVGYELVEHQGEAVESMIPMLERLAAARPVDHMPHKQLARLYLASPTPQKAIEHLEFLDQREQYSTTFAIELARRYAGIQDWDKATAKAERASRIAPFDPSVRELAATVAIKRKDWPTARRHIEAMIAIEPDREIHKKRLEALGKMEAAK